MQIVVKTLVGRTIQLEVASTDTIASVKGKITTQEKIPQNQQRLMFNGKPLEDQKTVDEYEIKQDSVLQLAVRGPTPEPHDSKSKSGFCSIM